jgi:hypothetical protein
MPHPIDHFVWGTPDLETGCADIETLFGVAPEPGGSHPGLGTCNALLSLGPGQYLEIMAPQNPPPGSVGDRLARLDAPGLITWVVRQSALSELARTVTDWAHDVHKSGPVKTERLTPDGTLLSWDLLFLTRHSYAGLLPFFIDWHETRHPSESAPRGGTLSEFSIHSAEAARLNAIYLDLDVSPVAQTAPESELRARFETPNGPAVLKSTPQSLLSLNS